MIVAVSHARDEHAPPVLAALRRVGAAAVLLDLADFPLRGTIALAHGGRGRSRSVLRTAGRTLDVRDVRAVWWRRPEPFDLGRRLSPADAEFSYRQVLEALGGLAASLDAVWVNDPWRDAAASHKPRQLALAGRLGLRVPETLVTNDAARARAFLSRRGRRVVHKTLHPTGEAWRPTRFVGPRDLERLAALRWAPVVFQEYVPGVDVRVTVVGDELFATEIDVRRTRSPEDFRPVWREAPVAACELPESVARRLRALVAELGLRFAAIDLRRRRDGEHVFLEVNPAGQWLFLEQRTGQPITAAVARLLATR